MTTAAMKIRVRPQHALTWLWLLLVSAAMTMTFAQTTSSQTTSMNYRWFCDLTLNPVVTLEWDPSINGYAVQKPRQGDFEYYNYGQVGGSTTDPSGSSTGTGQDGTTNQDHWTRRLTSLLRSVVWSDEDDDDIEATFPPLTPPNLRSPALLPQWDHNSPALPVPMAMPMNNRNNNSTNHDSRNLRVVQEREPQPVFVENNNDNNNNQINNNNNLYPFDNFQTLPPESARTVEARACDCWNSMVWGGAFFCPTPRTHCAIPSSPIGLPGCVDIQKQRRIVRSIWPVLVVWYASVLFCLSFTITGRHALSCCIATVYPGWNRRTAERLLQHDPNQANQMLLRHYRIMRARYERRLMRRLRRRARRDRRRARQRRRQEQAGGDNSENNNNNPFEDSSESELEEELPFPNLWDLAIIPRPINTSSDEPQPATLTLKTRIYKQKARGAADGKDSDSERSENEDDLSSPPKTKVEQFVDETLDESSSFVANEIVSPASSGIAESEDDNQNANESKEDGPAANDTNEGADTSCAGGTNPNNEVEKPDQSGKEDVGLGKPDGGVLADDAGKPNHDNGDDDNVMKQIDTKMKPVSTLPPPPCCAADPLDVSEWDDDNTCTICYAPLEDGDRVGALPCGHEFHVDPCLKHWLSRRNVCPLCLTENIATPRYADGTLAPLSQNNNEDDDDNAEGNNNQGGTMAMPPIILSFNPPPDESSSDQDRSSSRDRDDDNSSGILDDPNRIPAFASAPTDHPRGQQRSAIMSGFTSMFRRRRRPENNNDDGAPANDSSAPSEQAP